MLPQGHGRECGGEAALIIEQIIVTQLLAFIIELYTVKACSLPAIALQKIIHF